MTRSLTLSLALAAAAAPALAGSPRCDRGGATLLVWHDFDPCNLSGDPNQIDPWRVSGLAATPASGALYSGPWQVAGTADFDQDGTCDIAWELRGDDDVHVSIALSRLGNFVTPSDAGNQLMGRWQVVGTSDYVGLDDAAGAASAPDGRPDVVFWHPGTGELAVWAADAAGEMPGNLHAVAGRDLSWRPAVIANLDGNEASTTSEIVWRHEATGQLDYTNLVWRGGALLHSPGRLLDPPGPVAGGWRIRAADDFNGDGYEDLVFQNEVSYKSVVWFMHGPQRITGSFTNPAALMPECAAAAGQTGNDRPEYTIVGPR